MKKKNGLARIIAMILSVVIILNCSISAEAVGKKYGSFSKAAKAYLKDHNNGKNDAAYCNYYYIKLKTKKGVKKVMAVSVVLGFSGSLESTDVWIKSGKNVQKKYTFPGSIMKMSSNKDYILTYGTSGGGAGAYRLYKYNKKKGKYIQKCYAPFDTEAYKYPEREQNALKKIETKGNVNTSEFIDNRPSTKTLW